MDSSQPVQMVGCLSVRMGLNLKEEDVQTGANQVVQMGRGQPLVQMGLNQPSVPNHAKKDDLPVKMSPDHLARMGHVPGRESVEMDQNHCAMMERNQYVLMVLL